jgi:hypothetical protein
MFLASWICTSASFYPQYYLVVMPFWALLAAVGVVSFSSWAAAKWLLPAKGLAWGLTAVVLFLLCIPHLPWIAQSRQQFAAAKLAGYPFAESKIIAKRVAELTSPRDYVFVAGSEPQILCYAERFSPTRFVIIYPMMIPTPLTSRYQQEVIGDLEARPPAVIVLVQSPTSWLWQENTPLDFKHYLDQLLAEKYDVIGGYVPERDNGVWEEPLNPEDNKRWSLLLFRRKASR